VPRSGLPNPRPHYFASFHEPGLGFKVNQTDSVGSDFGGSFGLAGSDGAGC
jgi:hypothetical protein